MSFKISLKGLRHNHISHLFQTCIISATVCYAEVSQVHEICWLNFIWMDI